MSAIGDDGWIDDKAAVENGRAVSDERRGDDARPTRDYCDAWLGVELGYVNDGPQDLEAQKVYLILFLLWLGQRAKEELVAADWSCGFGGGMLLFGEG